MEPLKWRRFLLRQPVAERHMKIEQTSQPPVAIIGIGCIFAKSQDQKAFYRLLSKGISGITDPPESHRHLRDVLDVDPKKPDHIYCNRGGYLPPIQFDPTEFSIPPNVIEATDTSQLLGLVTAKKALDDAGYGENGRAFDRNKASVILGVTGTQELVIPLGARLGHPIWRRALKDAGVPDVQAEDVIERISDDYVSWQENSFPGLLGNVVAGRIANRLDLGGTNCVVDAACASSMGAIHMAMLELRSGRSDMVITGGVDTINDAFMHMCFSKTQILSASGDIRPFSQDADGTVLGEGIGLVVLKRLEDAERDGDRIYAVVRGLASSSDGKSQSIYAPRSEGQAKALRGAYAEAGIDPATVSLVEAHGTGTRVGDQVEFRSLCDVFGETSPNGNRCALGSVKSNIGHTKAAAGTAGLIKTALSIYHKVLPPTLKAEPADPKLGVEHSPFYLNTKLRPWIEHQGEKRRAGVSAFGFGGSNFHAVLEEHAQCKLEPAWDGTVEIAAFSGENENAVAEQIDEWRRDVLQDCATHHIGKCAKQSRKQFNAKDAVRLLMVIDLDGGREHLSSICADAVNRLRGESGTPANRIYLGKGAPQGGVAFLFPGQGSQYVGMGRDLICCFPESLNAFEEAVRHLDTEETLDDYLYPRRTSDADTHESRLRQTHIAQPAIGAVSVAMMEALKRFGIAPDATCGHSYGELVALHAAGWMTRKDLWRLSAERGRLMAQAGETAGEKGTMLAVQAPLEEVERLVSTMDDQVVLANRNSPGQGILSGSAAGIEAAEELCSQKGWRTVRLPVAAAFHSPMVADAQKPFGQCVASVRFQAGSTPVMSNTLGGAYPGNIEEIQATLGKQLACSVDFVSNIENLYAQGIRTFVEVGPKTVLSRLVESIITSGDVAAIAVDASAGRGSGVEDLASTISQLAAMGYEIDLGLWEKPQAGNRKARMAIHLTGANVRNQGAKRKKAPKPSESVSPQPPAAQPSAAPPKAYEDKPVQTPVAPAAPAVDHVRTAPTPSVSQRERKQPHSTTLHQALSTVQQGMASLQALQAQTVEAHQKFLETQAAASRTLQQMIQGARQLATGTQTHVAPVDVEQTTYHHPTPAMAVTVEPPSPPVEQQTIAFSQADWPVEKRQTTAAGPDNAEIESGLLEIVSRLTGYPEEMLAMEMDIESDLGIDSIKRVEILSALEERMPDLPKVTPDMMGTLKTLGQIVAFLSSAPAGAAEPEKQTAAPAPASPSADGQQIQAVLVEIVGALTGYPEEMLAMEMDIESDLGIDSIKRVEILSALEERMPDLPKVTPDMMGTLKTLGQIVDYLNGPASDRVIAAKKKSQPDIHLVEKPHTEAVPRQIVRIEKLEDCTTEAIAISEEHYIGVTGADIPLKEHVIDRFRRRGFKVKPLEQQDDLKDHPNLAGLVLISPIEARKAFEWARTAARRLQASAATSNAFLATVSFLDGAFGFKNGSINNPAQGALAGLVKTAAIEWPAVRCLALDVDPKWEDTAAVAEAVCDELLHSDVCCRREIGISPDGRIGLNLAPVPAVEAEPVSLRSEDVVVVTGGARGVTAAAAKALAASAGGTLVLMGRSPAPRTEPTWMRPLSDEGEIKKAIFSNWQEASSASPKAVEAVYRRWMANRDVLSTLDQLQQSGVKAHYVSVDVRDGDAMEKELARIRKDIGSIRAVVHGAGVLEDRLIVDKKTAQFEKVYGTKVEGLEALLRATGDDALRYLVIFSSVAARMGNTGQVDYAMANEVLNKMALQQASRRPDCKVISINWGPWDGGMVTPGLKRNFLKQGISLIPISQGAQAMVEEMAQPRGGAVEVVIGGPLPQAQTDEIAPASPSRDLSLTCKRDVSVERYPVLNSHQLDGRPVVPLALITEWLAHSALHANPGLLLYGMDNLRLLNGITLDQQSRQVRMLAGKTLRRDGLYAVDVEVRDGGQGPVERIHSSASAILSEQLPAPPVFSENGHFKPGEGIAPLEEIYQHILFHGRDLQGIQEIIRVSREGITARVATAPPPAQWINGPMRSRWIADPLVLDCAFQMAIVWCHHQHGQVCLPSFATAYRQYCRRFPVNGVSAVLEVRQCTGRKMTGDFTFLDADKKVLAQLKGYEAIMDPNLMKAFKAA